MNSIKMNSIKLTRRTALELTKELWTWLADHPSATKSMWPRWKELDEMMAACPCCEYDEQQRELETPSCDNCPLAGRWGLDNAQCTATYTPFVRWCRASSDLAAKVRAAQDMVRLCDEALADLEPGDESD